MNKYRHPHTASRGKRKRGRPLGMWTTVEKELTITGKTSNLIKTGMVGEDSIVAEASHQIKRIK